MAKPRARPRRRSRALGKSPMSIADRRQAGRMPRVRISPRGTSSPLNSKPTGKRAKCDIIQCFVSEYDGEMCYNAPAASGTTNDSNT